MLLNILQHKERSPATKIYLALNVTSVVVEKPYGLAVLGNGSSSMYICTTRPISGEKQDL